MSIIYLYLFFINIILGARNDIKMYFREMNYCILDDKVYDITNVAHPGGLFVID